jgi:GT2 family glycosyltransferase
MSKRSRHSKSRPIVSQKPNSQITSRAPIDLVITTAGRFDMLEKCLESVYREAQLIPLNVYIFDNASDAAEKQQNIDMFSYHSERDSLGGIKRWKSERVSENIGFAGGANRGARLGNAPLIMFLSDDVILEGGAIEKVISSFKDGGVGIVGIKTLFPLTSTDKFRPAGKIQHIGLALNIRADPIHPLVGWSANHPKAQITRDVLAVTGACLTVRRELFQKVGGFDLIYGKGTYEDIDLCLKVRQLGFRIVINADAIGYHHVGASAEKRREPFPLQQNNMIFKSRWANTPLFQWDEWTYW